METGPGGLAAYKVNYDPPITPLCCPNHRLTRAHRNGGSSSSVVDTYTIRFFR